VAFSALVVVQVGCLTENGPLQQHRVVNPADQCSMYHQGGSSTCVVHIACLPDHEVCAKIPHTKFTKSISHAVMSLYSPLVGKLAEIRLLHIKRGNPSSPIECLLKVVPHGEFSRHNEGIYDWVTGKAHGDLTWRPESTGREPMRWVPEYEALSYTWGDPKATELITLNGRVVDVTKNLKAALLALRKPDAERVMWIDALCINQRDIQEKNTQLPRMSAIYQRASRTIAWLDPANVIAHHAMDVLERLGGTKTHMDGLEMPKPMIWNGPQFDACYGVGEEVEREVFQRRLTHASRQNLARLEDLNESDWTALEEFINRRPYWRRLWIIQEIANSREVIFQCGSRQIGIETFQYFPLIRGDGSVSPQLHL
jgi:hypothetical protein